MVSVTVRAVPVLKLMRLTTADMQAALSTLRPALLVMAVVVTTPLAAIETESTSVPCSDGFLARA